ncbi:MAG: hypothetical protein RL133_663 [Pseudomonadota bacterium]
MASCTLAELMIVAASEAWRNNGEVLANGIGPGPRLAASLAKLTHSPELLMTDSESRLVEEPIPLGPRTGPLEGYVPRYSGRADFSRIFDMVWRGKRHAMIGPTQIDGWGQTNLSCIGDYRQPKSAILGVRGLPGNSISHRNSFFMPSHSKRVFVSRVDMVSGAGRDPAQWPDGRVPELQFGLVISNLGVFDLEAPVGQMRVVSLHPGVSLDMVAEQTGFSLLHDAASSITPLPTEEQLDVLRRLDPHDFRSKILKGNPIVDV